VGLDLDGDALKLARELGPRLLLVRGSGEALPFRDASFDLVASRVALPYMDFRLALPEIDRVLLPGGQLWCTLHPLRMTLVELGGNLRRFQIKGALFRLLVLINGLLLHAFGRAPMGRESAQTVRGFRRALVRAGFSAETIRVDQGRFMIATARK
jgi:SAM-dependent methyltransferase